MEEASSDQVLDVDGVTITGCGRGKGKEGVRTKVERIRKSVLYDGEGRYVHVVRITSWGGNSVTFVLNPDPDLYSDTNKFTQGRAMIDFSKEFLEANPSFEGIYIDSLWRWGEFYNHRVEHFRYADVPLTYNPHNKEVAIKNEFSHIELLRKLSKTLHEQGRLLFGNGVRPGRFFSGAVLDVLGVEDSHPEVGKFPFYRTCAYQRPFLILCYKYGREVVRAYVQKSILYGLFPSMGTEYWMSKDFLERDKDLLNPFLPLLEQISAAGWEPVTCASSSDKEVLYERFGMDDSGNFYFTVYNSTEVDKEVSLEIQIKELGMNRIESVKELVERKGLNPSFNIKMLVPKSSPRILRVQGD